MWSQRKVGTRRFEGGGCEIGYWVLVGGLRVHLAKPGSVMASWAGGGGGLMLIVVPLVAVV